MMCAIEGMALEEMMIFANSLKSSLPPKVEVSQKVECSQMSMIAGMITEFIRDRDDETIKPKRMPLTRDRILREIDYLIDGPPVEVENGTKIFILHLEDTEERDLSEYTSKFTEFYLEYYITDCYLPEGSGARSSYKIFSLIVPAHLQRQGIATYILNRIEEKAYQEHRRVLIEPVMEEPMFNFLAKRGTYRQRNIFSFYLA